MKLELKHLAPYLPYGLNVLANQRQRTLHGVSQDVAYLYYNGLKPYFFKEFKPILRPLSDLAKEIEVNGVKFIPIMVIFGGEDYRKYDFTINVVEKPILGKRIEISIKDIGSPCIMFGLKNPLNNTLIYQNWELLFSLHFDVFNLIDKGLAIDINTLNK